jgi:DNA polymerase-2
MTLWLIPESGSPERLKLNDPSFRPCFYVHGPACAGRAEPRLKRLAQTLAARARVACRLTERLDIWAGRALRVLEVRVEHPTLFAPLARFVGRFDSSLRLYNSDLMLAPLYCWEKNIFPLAKVEVEANGAVVAVGACPDAGRDRRAGSPLTERRYSVRAIHALDDAWATDYELPPLRTLTIRMEGLARVDPQHGRRGALEVEADGDLLILDDADEPVAQGFERLLRARDPDLILSEWGDSTLFPGLLRQARKLGLKLSLNRDPDRGGTVERSRARSYVSYGRILFKESAATLRGRLHVDTQNSFIAGHCELDGLWELARVTKLPVQYCARTTTGTGISYMQMEIAWRDGTLIPQQKAEPESPKHPDELLRADRGGLVFPPRLGFFTNVGELDFVSEFPSIMARFNVSPETVNCRCCPEAPRVPELGYRICRKRRGITSRVVERLIEKREVYKRRMAQAGLGTGDPGLGGKTASRASGAAAPTCSAGVPSGDGDEDIAATTSPESPVPSPARYHQRRSALKWLLVCCFGYTGYKNARFGKIEAHEAINALAREKLLVAMETAERAGYRVLHALVDSLYVQRENATRADYEALARRIEQATRLPMAVEAVYRYVVFLPSKQSPEVPVPNRFFCVPEPGGEVKIRGLECRRHDTPPLVARMQREALAILAEAHDWESYCRKLEEAREVLRHALERVEQIAATRVGIEELVISKRMTRPPDTYRHASSTAIAARQLDRAGVKLRPGETIEYILTDTDSNLADDRVRAYTMWEAWRGYDIAKYRDLLLEAFRPLEYYAVPRAPGLTALPASFTL